MRPTRHDGRLMSYDDSWDLPIEPVVVQGQFTLPGGSLDVTIYPNIKSGHNSSSPHPTDEHPSLYWIIPHVIAQGQHYPSTSQNPAHLQSLATSHTEVYQLDNVYELLDNSSWYSKWQNYSIVVPVRYPRNGGKNRAKTFYVAPNPTGRQLG